MCPWGTMRHSSASGLLSARSVPGSTKNLAQPLCISNFMLEFGHEEKAVDGVNCALN